MSFPLKTVAVCHAATRHLRLSHGSHDSLHHCGCSAGSVLVDDGSGREVNAGGHIQTSSTHQATFLPFLHCLTAFKV